MSALHCRCPTCFWWRPCADHCRYLAPDRRGFTVTMLGPGEAPFGTGGPVLTEPRARDFHHGRHGATAGSAARSRRSTGDAAPFLLLTHPARQFPHRGVCSFNGRRHFQANLRALSRHPSKNVPLGGHGLNLLPYSRRDAGIELLGWEPHAGPCDQPVNLAGPVERMVEPAGAREAGMIVVCAHRMNDGRAETKIPKDLRSDDAVPGQVVAGCADIDVVQ